MNYARFPLKHFTCFQQKFVTIRRKKISFSNALVSWHSILSSAPFFEKKLNYALDSYELCQIPIETLHLLPAKNCRLIQQKEISVSNELVSFEKRLSYAIDSYELCHIPTEAFRLLPAKICLSSAKRDFCF